MKLMWLAALAGCGPGLKQQPTDTREVGQETLVGASGDAAAIARLFEGPLTNGGLWFDEPACASEFGSPGEITDDRRSEFARCLAGLRWRASTRKSAIGDVTVLTYEPGFEIEARVVEELAGPRLRWIGFSARGSGDFEPTIMPETLEALRSGPRGALDPQAMPEEGNEAYAWIRLCIDETGAVSRARSFEASSARAANAFVQLARSWTFQPFQRQGQPMPVCSIIRLPGAIANQRIPLPPPPPSPGDDEPVMLGEGRFVTAKRIRGSAMIVPDDKTKTAIAISRRTRIEGAFRLCLDRTGKPASILPIRSTRFAAYDRKLMAGMSSWLYSPFLVDGKARPVCTLITFIYRQRQSNQRRM